MRSSSRDEVAGIVGIDVRRVKFASTHGICPRCQVPSVAADSCPNKFGIPESADGIGCLVPEQIRDPQMRRWDRLSGPRTSSGPPHLPLDLDV